MEVKKGYKQTEVGVIPEDWRDCRFDDLLTGFNSGMTPSRRKPEYYKGNIPWVTSGELNHNVILDTKEKITSEAVKKTNLKILPKGTFLMAITGLEAEGTRGSCGVLGIDATTNQSCMALFPKEDLTMEYLFHYYNFYGDFLALKYCQGTKQQSYTARTAKLLPINLPSNSSEQTAIANALSDTDKLIQSLEKLIAKKRAIKQGTMKELLTPKEGWVQKKLGEICSPSKERYNPVMSTKNFKCIELEHIMRETGRLLGYVNSKEQLSQKTIFSKNDVLFGKLRPYLRKYLYASFDGVCSTEIWVLKTQLGVIQKWLYYLIQSNEIIELANQSVGTKMPRAEWRIVENAKVYVPEITEQMQIANILSEIDTEINFLEEKRAKYKQIKHGMMQNLLTGKIRLI